MIMNSLNAATVVSLLKNDHRDQLESLLINECRKLESVGCDFIAITCNSVHAFYDSIQEALNVPVIHIIDSVANLLINQRIKKVGVIGTQFTVKNCLYDKYLQPFGIDSIYPSNHEIKRVDDIIFSICSGEMPSNKEKQIIQEICDRLINSGAKAIVLGCTELGMCIDSRTDVPLFDSAVIHAKALASYSINKEQENPKFINSKIGFHREPEMELIYV